MPGPVENMKLLQELQDAINTLPTMTGGVIIEDEWGQKYELVRSYAIGRCTDDPGLVLKVRMYSRHPDA